MLVPRSEVPKDVWLCIFPVISTPFPGKRGGEMPCCSAYLCPDADVRAPYGAGLLFKPTVELEDGITQIRSRRGSTLGSKNKDLDLGGKATVVLSFDPPSGSAK